jgi:hypothetical protein
VLALALWKAGSLDLLIGLVALPAVATPVMSLRAGSLHRCRSARRPRDMRPRDGDGADRAGSSSAVLRQHGARRRDWRQRRLQDVRGFQLRPAWNITNPHGLGPARASAW